MQGAARSASSRSKSIAASTCTRRHVQELPGALEMVEGASSDVMRLPLGASAMAS